jgi:hypothetical protein
LLLIFEPIGSKTAPIDCTLQLLGRLIVLGDFSQILVHHFQLHWPDL